MDTNKKVPKSSDKFFCTSCDYTTIRKSQYERHLLTLKHGILTNTNKKVQKVQDDKSFKCVCGSSYKFASSLCYHKKTCKVEEKSTSLVVKENITDKDQLILMLIKQNSELIKETSDFKNLMVEQQNMMMKVLENGTNNTTNTIQKPRINTINSL